MQIMEIGQSWRAGCGVSHAFYCLFWLLFQSPVTEALAMTRKVIKIMVIKTMQFNLKVNQGIQIIGLLMYFSQY